MADERTVGEIHSDELTAACATLKAFDAANEVKALEALDDIFFDAAAASPRMFILRLARLRAINDLEAEKGVSRDKAEEAVFSLSEEDAIFKIAQMPELAKALADTPPPKRGKVRKWIVDHKDLLIALAKIFFQVAIMFLSTS